MSKLAEIVPIITGAHVLGNDSLRDYHTARTVRDALRCKPPLRLLRIKQLLHPYRVTVAIAYDPSRIEIRNPATGRSIVL